MKSKWTDWKTAIEKALKDKNMEDADISFIDISPMMGQTEIEVNIMPMGNNTVGIY